MTPNSIWKPINQAALHLILYLLAPLGSYGLHPPFLRKADGILIDKPGKLSYDCPCPFRIIILLLTFPQIPERIMNSGLSCVAP